MGGGFESFVSKADSSFPGCLGLRIRARVLAERLLPIPALRHGTDRLQRRIEVNGHQPARRMLEYWVIPPKADAEFGVSMEEILETYGRPIDAGRTAV